MKSLLIKSLVLFPIISFFLFKGFEPLDAFSIKNDKDAYVAVPPIKLPIEVLGPDGYTRTTTFSLKNPKNAEFLYLKIHKPSYRDASRNKARGGKASVKINSGGWIDLTNDNVEVFPHEKAYGGLNGSYHTVRMKLPATFVLGQNKVAFRFNGTDGITNGFRVLELNVMKGDTKLMNDSFFQYDDPGNWKAPLPSKKDIDQGKVLWFNKTLREGPLADKNLRSKCASCHAKDGRDLKYFNYSNWSIIERSKFHGLTEKEGKQIASYIRSLNVNAPKIARPWNPPYQPGPGLDKKPVSEWAAGAGLDWVLEKDEDMIPYAFNGNDKESIRKVININSTLNVRETPIALQFPDWNDWLPVIHPMDMVGKPFEEVKVIKLDGKTYSYNGAYERIRELLETNPVDALIKNRKLYTYLNTFSNHSSQFHDVTYFESNPKIRQKDKLSFYGLRTAFSKWSAVKQWEFMHTFALEDKAPQIYPKDGEARSWLTKRRNVFEIAPHRSAFKGISYAYQTPLVGKYFSTAWYQLQVTLNSGNKAAYSLSPVDWNYQPKHIKDVKGAGGPYHFLRHVLSHTKMLQQFNDNRPLGSSMMGFRQLHPGYYAGFYNTAVKYYSPTVSRRIIESLIHSTVDVLENYTPDQWHKAKDNNKVRHAQDKVIKPILPAKLSEQIYNRYGSAWMTSILIFRKQGISEPTLKRMIDWGEKIWPTGDWSALRSIEDTQPLLMEAENFTGSSEQSDPQGNTWIVSDKTKGYSGKGYVGTPDVDGAAGDGFANSAALFYNFAIKEPGRYYIWVKRYARGGTSDSAHFGIDGKELKSIDHSGNYNQWRWVRIEKVNLAAGNHTLQIARREDGYLIDQILISTRGSKIDDTATISLEAENYSANLRNGDAVEQAFFASQYVEGFEGSGYMATKNQNSPASTDGENAALYYHFNTSERKTYHLWIRKYASDGQGNSATFSIDNLAFDNVDNTSVYNVWKWIKIGSRTLLPGAHLVKINRREDGYRIDRIVVTTDSQKPGAQKSILPASSANDAAPLTLYPNPVRNGLVTLYVPGQSQLTPNTIRLLDNTGKLLQAKIDTNESECTLDVSAYPAGLYFITYLHEGRRMQRKFIIE